jgi:hypothetical protein
MALHSNRSDNLWAQCVCAELRLNYLTVSVNLCETASRLRDLRGISIIFLNIWGSFPPLMYISSKGGQTDVNCWTGIAIISMVHGSATQFWIKNTSDHRHIQNHRTDGDQILATPPSCRGRHTCHVWVWPHERWRFGKMATCHGSVTFLPAFLVVMRTAHADGARSRPLMTQITHLGVRVSIFYNTIVYSCVCVIAPLNGGFAH